MLAADAAAFATTTKTIFTSSVMDVCCLLLCIRFIIFYYKWYKKNQHNIVAGWIIEAIAGREVCSFFLLFLPLLQNLLTLLFYYKHKCEVLMSGLI